MKTSYTHNNFLAYLAILAGFFILLFFTKNIFIKPALSIQRNTSKLQVNLTLGSAFEQLDRNAKGI